MNRVVILEKVLKLIVFVLALVSVLGIFQYILQHSLGLSFIGEPVISSETLGVAKVALFDLEVLRSYGTFPHPNIFGAYLVLGILICIFLLRKSNKNARFYLFPALAVFCLTLILTFSRSAFLALFVSLIFYYVVSRIKVSLKYILSAAVLVVLFVYFLDLSSVLSTRIFLGDSAGSIERWQYLDISKNMFMDKPFGVGIGNFTALMQDYSSSKILPWNFQPVHNLYLLVLNEIGVQGFLLFLCFLSSLFLFIWKKLRNRELAHFLLASFLALFVLSLFDHYLFSIYQGQALFLTFVAMIGALDYH
ncbi:MAG: O-antigen ligase family protein [bacterium]|nr:O-antigen ligase family protein [bacterium]